jgi:hypothetical protein
MYGQTPLRSDANKQRGIYRKVVLHIGNWKFQSFKSTARQVTELLQLVSINHFTYAIQKKEKFSLYE